MYVVSGSKKGIQFNLPGVICNNRHEYFSIYGGKCHKYISSLYISSQQEHNPLKKTI